jgi:hypothetical protein
MPIPTQFPEGSFSTFWGDYAGLTAVENANPLWSDTRDPDLFACPGTLPITTPPSVCGATVSTGNPNNPNETAPVNDQNIYTANNSVPNTK